MRVLLMELGVGDNMILIRNFIRKGDQSHFSLSQHSSRLVDNAKRVIETESASQLETISTFGRDVGMGNVSFSTVNLYVSYWCLVS